MKLALKDYPGKFFRFFKSVRLSAITIASLIVIYSLGLILPQKWMFESREQYLQWKEINLLNRFLDFIGFTDIYLSPLTIVLLGIFFINLLVVTLSRIPVVLKRMYLFGEHPAFTADTLKKVQNVKSIPLDVHSTGMNEAVKTFFKKRKWHLINGKKGDTFAAIKNRFSPIGFLLFHLSFLLCLIGGLLITYTRFSGNMVLTEGQAFEGNIQQFHRINREPKILKKLPALALYLEKVQPFYENDVPTELAVTLQVKYQNDLQREVLKVNEPIKRGQLSIIAEDIGVSPLFVIRGPSGKELDGAYVSLNVLKGQEDYFQFEGDKRFKFYVRFFPDYVVENGIEKTQSIELKNPAIHLTIEKKGKKIYKGTIKQGEYAKLGPYTTISFDDIRYWVEFLVVREYGKIPLVVGFLFASIGLITRLVFYQKRLRLAIEYENNKILLYIDGRSEYFPHSFKEEMNRLVKELDDFLKKSKVN